MELKSWPESSQVSITWYFPDTQALRVNFRTGAEYRYDKVPREVWEKLKNATSIGKFINSEIKGKYEFVKTN